MMMRQAGPRIEVDAILNAMSAQPPIVRARGRTGTGGGMKEQPSAALAAG